MQAVSPSGVPETASDQQPLQPKPQKKGKDKKILSCHFCRRRKLKCDRSDPCGACQARGEGHLCTWEEGQRPEKNNRESLEQLPNLISKLTEEVREVKAWNRELLEVIRYKIPDTISEPFRPDRKRWTQSRVVALLPGGRLVRGLILQFVHTFASLTGFIDVHQLFSEVEQVERFRQQKEDDDSTFSPDNLIVRVSLILACASLAAVNLDAIKAQELGLAQISIDVFARDLWTNARSLITHLDSDSFTTSFETTNYYLTEPVSTSASIYLLRVVAIKLVLLLAARSFASPSEHIKLHLDTISSATQASLGSYCGDDIPLEERERRWQLCSFLCVLDWTSPSIYHNGSYFLRPKMQMNPPSKAPGVLDDETHAPIPIESDQLERLSQTRYFLEYALALANLSRRAEDCILRPGPILPTQAAELCSELDTLDNKLSFYQLLGCGGARKGSAPGSGVSDTGGGSEKYRVSFQRALQVQNEYLSLELGLIRFKLFRHEAFHLMHDANVSSALRVMCMDACLDACIFVLSQCRNIGMAKEGMQITTPIEFTNAATDREEEKRPPLGTFRRVIQPASSAALIGQILLHVSQSADGLGLLTPKRHPNSSIPTTLSDFSYAEPPMESFVPYHFSNGNGSASWTGQFDQEKVHILQWHVDNVMTALEELQPTSTLARYRLALHRQCI